MSAIKLSYLVASYIVLGIVTYQNIANILIPYSCIRFEYTHM